MGPSLDLIEPITQNLMETLRKRFPASQGHQIRSTPNLNNESPQIIIKPISEKLSDAGITAQDLARAVDVYNDGIRVTEIPFENQLIDMVLSSNRASDGRVDDLRNMAIVSKSGQSIDLEQLALIEIIGKPAQIKRLSGRRVITLQLRPHEKIPLESAVIKLETNIIKELEETLPENVFISLSGAASELERTWTAMQQNVLSAMVVIYLLLTILMRSFVLPLVIMITVPVAGAGGIIGLIILNQFSFQPLDMLTMLGFIILTGIVVNNAILMVEQTLWHFRIESMSLSQAITEATSNRIRPIFMSTLTSLFGLIPLVIFPGAGSELYRGIGTVVFGGLATSAILTLLMVPPLLTLALKGLQRPSKANP